MFNSFFCSHSGREEGIWPGLGLYSEEPCPSFPRGFPYTSVSVVLEGIQFIFLYAKASRDSCSQTSLFPQGPIKTISNVCRTRIGQRRKSPSIPCHPYRKVETQRVGETHPGSHSSMKAKLSLAQESPDFLSLSFPTAPQNHQFKWC